MLPPKEQALRGGKLGCEAWGRGTAGIWGPSSAPNLPLKSPSVVSGCVGVVEGEVQEFAIHIYSRNKAV